MITGVRAAVSLIYNARQGEMEERVNREVQAQRLLEPNPSLFRLLELGSERDGTRFYVSELQAEQTFTEALKEWRRPSNVLTRFAQAGAILQPLLGLLCTAHRFGIAHGELDASQIYVSLTDSLQGPEPALARPRLYGLRRMAAGPALAAAVRSDLLFLGHLLFELLCGQRARLPLSLREQEALRTNYGEAVAGFVARALTGSPDSDTEGFTAAEEMQRRLIPLLKDAPVPVPPPEPAACVSVDPFAERTDPTAAPSRMSIQRQTAAARETTQAGATPLPELPLEGRSVPQKFGFSGELRQVSFADLLVLPQAGASYEVVARGKHQTSLPDGLSPARAPLPVRPSLDEEPEIEVVAEPSSLPGLLDLHAEPTRSLRTQVFPGPNISTEPTQPPAMPQRVAQPAKFKLWGWWKR
jgi:hypothetical protein